MAWSFSQGWKSSSVVYPSWTNNRCPGFKSHPRSSLVFFFWNAFFCNLSPNNSRALSKTHWRIGRHFSYILLKWYVNWKQQGQKREENTMTLLRGLVLVPRVAMYQLFWGGCTVHISRVNCKHMLQPKTSANKPQKYQDSLGGVGLLVPGAVIYQLSGRGINISSEDCKHTYVTKGTFIRTWYLYIYPIYSYVDSTHIMWYQVKWTCNPSGACVDYSTYHHQAPRTQNGCGPEEG